MLFNPEDYKKMYLDVSKLDMQNDDIFEKIPEVNNHETFQLDCNLSKTKVIAFIAFVYDPNSPFVKKYWDNVSRRKYQAAKEAEFPQEEGRFAKDVEDMIQGKIVNINYMALGYMRIWGNDEWSALMIYRERLYKDLHQLKNPTKGDKLDKVLERTKTLREEISLLTKKFLVNDTTDGVVYDLQSAIEADDLIPRPEDIASRLEKRERVLPYWVNPYREGVSNE